MFTHEEIQMVSMVWFIVMCAAMLIPTVVVCLKPSKKQD